MKIPSNTKILTLPGIYSYMPQEIQFQAAKPLFVQNVLEIQFSDEPNCFLVLGSDFDETVIHLISVRDIQNGECLTIGTEFRAQNVKNDKIEELAKYIIEADKEAENAQPLVEVKTEVKLEGKEAPKSENTI